MLDDVPQYRGGIVSHFVDLAFSLQSPSSIPADHGYALYGAVSKTLPALHQREGYAIHPIRGTQLGNRQLMLTARSHLVIRTTTDLIPQLIPLAGTALNVANVSLRIGVPQVRALQPATALRSRLVTIKINEEITAAAFLAALEQQLRDLSLSDQVFKTLGKRRTICIKGKEVVGYELILEGLPSDESLNLQERGIGGRRRMGCGVFLPRGIGE